MSLRDVLLIVRTHPSAILLAVQILGVVSAPFLEGVTYGQTLLNAMSLVVLAVTVRMVRRTPWHTWISVVLAVPIVGLLVAQVTKEASVLLPWSAGLEAVFYAYAAGSLIAYMMEDYRTTRDELFAAAATFTLLVWAFTHLFVMIQALQPEAFAITGQGAVRTWTELNHLSFALLTSTGMGDVVAVSPQAKAFASLEMMTGMLYLGIVIGRLTGFTTQPESTTRWHKKTAD